MRPTRHLALAALALAGTTARAQAVVQVDDDRYEATVMGFQTYMDGQGSRCGTLTLRLHSLAKVPLILAADSIEGVATDDAGLRYWAIPSGALAQAITGGVVDPFMLPPGGTADALLRLYTLTPPASPPGTVFHVRLPIADVVKGAKGGQRVGSERTLHITGLTAAEFAPRSEGEADGLPRAVAAPFAVRMTSATVAPAAEKRGMAVVMSFEVTNLTAAPLGLARDKSIAYAVDGQGRTYREGGWEYGTWYDVGIPDNSTYDVSPRFTLAPGASRSFSVAMLTSKGEISDTERLGVYIGLFTLREAPDGKHHCDQDYALSFLYARPTARSTTPIRHRIGE